MRHQLIDDAQGTSAVEEYAQDRHGKKDVVIYCALQIIRVNHNGAE